MSLATTWSLLVVPKTIPQPSQAGAIPTYPTLTAASTGKVKVIVKITEKETENVIPQPSHSGVIPAYPTLIAALTGKVEVIVKVTEKENENVIPQPSQADVIPAYPPLTAALTGKVKVKVKVIEKEKENVPVTVKLTYAKKQATNLAACFCFSIESAL